MIALALFAVGLLSGGVLTVLGLAALGAREGRRAERSHTPTPAPPPAPPPRSGPLPSVDTAWAALVDAAGREQALAVALVVVEPDGVSTRFHRWDAFATAASPPEVAEAVAEAVRESLTEMQTPGGVEIED